MDHYSVLGVDHLASAETIKAAYHRKLLASHPDKTGRADSGAVARIKAAYRAVADPARRAAYDAELQEACKKLGFLITGAGLDVYTLESFAADDGAPCVWRRDCPRCTAQASFELTEEDLDAGTPDGLGGYQIMVSCQSCSLWITVQYEECED